MQLSSRGKNKTQAYKPAQANSNLVAGSALSLRELVDHAHIAQSVEHFLGKEEVTGSNPVMSSSTYDQARILIECKFKCIYWYSNMANAKRGESSDVQGKI